MKQLQISSIFLVNQANEDLQFVVQKFRLFYR